MTPQFRANGYPRDHKFTMLNTVSEFETVKRTYMKDRLPYHWAYKAFADWYLRVHYSAAVSILNLIDDHFSQYDNNWFIKGSVATPMQRYLNTFQHNLLSTMIDESLTKNYKLTIDRLDKFYAHAKGSAVTRLLRMMILNNDKVKVEMTQNNRNLAAHQPVQVKFERLELW